MILIKNILLKDRESSQTFRLLDEVASSETKDNAATHVVLIDIGDAKAIPVFFGKLKLLERLAERQMIVESETYSGINLSNLSQAETHIIERRWRLWEAVKIHGDKLYNSEFRGQLAQQLALNKVASKPYFYTTLRLMWQRGAGKESFVSKYQNCGRPGEKRIALEGAPKPGRPRTIQPGTGVAATEQHRANMRLAWSRSPVGRDGRGLRGAWIWMLIARYPEHVHLHPGDGMHVEVKNYDAVPTFEQFEYHWKQEFSFELRQLNRLQKRKFELAFKPLLTGTLTEVRGPGTRYYIDATVLDVYCVSRLNRRRIVGRPTLYVVVDQFSRLIVGIYVGLEPPCWAGAMLALWNCSIGKVGFCAQYDVEITEEMWPTGHMPLHLMGDRGELASSQADRLSIGFNLDVENARPYAGEAKGVGERQFGTIQTKFGPYHPGYVDKEFSGRDAEPAALRGAMDIHEITRTMILSVLHVNLRVVKEYEGWPEVISAGVPFVPLALWKWGVENLRCDARRFDEAHLKRYLWPEDSMKMSRKALHFHRGLYYMGVDLGAQPWFAKSFIERDRLPVLYHPLAVNNALVLPTQGRTGAYEVELTRRSKRFADMALSEVMALSHQSRVTNAAAQWGNQPQQALFEKLIHETTKNARRKAAELAEPSLSRAQRLKSIRANKADEIDFMTSEAMLATTGLDPTGRVMDMQVSDVAEPSDKTIDSVRKLIDSRRNKGNPSSSDDVRPGQAETND